MRKNIFEIMSDHDREKEIERLHTLFEKTIVYSVVSDFDHSTRNYSLRGFVEVFCFDKWKSKGHCLGVDDFLETVGYSDILKSAEKEMNDFLTLLEIVGNFGHLLNKEYQNMKEKGLLSGFAEYYGKLNQINNIVKGNLSHYNHKGVYDEATEQFLVIEDNPAAIEVAAIVEDVELSMAILKYNHYSLRNSINDKWIILVLIGKSMEPLRKKFSDIDENLTDDVFYALNNLDIRHNNKTEGDKNYKAYLSDMTSEELITAYDDVYQMMLLLYLKKEQVERDVRFKALKTNIENGNDDK